MTDNSSEFIRVYGVRHTDPQNKQVLLDSVDSPAGPVFHEAESPEKRKFTHSLVWAISAPGCLLATLLNYAGDTTEALSECEKAAMALAEREGVSVTYLGLNRLERAKRTYFLHMICWTPLALGPSLNISFIHSALLTAILIIFDMPVGRWHEHRIREAAWAEKISARTSNDDSAVIIVGNKHLRSLAKRLSQGGFDVRTVSIYQKLR